MSDKTPEQIIALAKQCGAGGYGDRLLAFTPGELQAFAAALTAARPVDPAMQTAISLLDQCASALVRNSGMLNRDLAHDVTKFTSRAKAAIKATS